MKRRFVDRVSNREWKRKRNDYRIRVALLELNGGQEQIFKAVMRTRPGLDEAKVRAMIDAVFERTKWRRVRMRTLIG